MTIDLLNYEEQAKEAVKTFWNTRLSAKDKQDSHGKADQGERGGVTAGKNMDGFLGLMIDIIKANGLTDVECHIKKKVLTLPGYFRPTKSWDVLVMDGNHLIAALEFKSQVGSFGNNFNNRCEESIGTAHDFATAYREGAFGDCSSPFVGWLILLEDDPKSRSPVENSAPHFPVMKAFKDASYADRYDVLCRRLIKEKLYTSASVILSPRSAITDGEYSEMSEMTSLRSFVAALAGHAATESTKRN